MGLLVSPDNSGEYVNQARLFLIVYCTLSMPHALLHCGGWVYSFPLTTMESTYIRHVSALLMHSLAHRCSTPRRVTDKYVVQRYLLLPPTCEKMTVTDYKILRPMPWAIRQSGTILCIKRFLHVAPRVCTSVLFGVMCLHMAHQSTMLKDS